MKVCTLEQNRNFDTRAMEEYGFSPLVLMENAALAVADSICSKFSPQKLKVLILAGPGNNGGDGLALARILFSRGAFPAVYTLSTSSYTGAAAENLSILQKINIPLRLISDLEENQQKLSEADLIVDAVFGTGLSREVSGEIQGVFDSINKSKTAVFAVDIPSGINGNSGKILGTAIKADFTMTFGTPKPGHYLYPGAEYTGKLEVSTISFPPRIIKEAKPFFTINKPPLLKERPVNGHKGTFGKVLLVAGSGNYYGAPFFSAQAALLCGAGYVWMAIPESMVATEASMIPEAVFIPQPENEKKAISGEALEKLLKVTDAADSLVIGPGLSRNTETLKMAESIIMHAKCPVIVDGDALHAISNIRNKPNMILTPHVAELAAILGKSVAYVLEKPVEALSFAGKQFGCCLVLKGAHSLIYTPSGIYCNLTGNSGMGTAGSGDVLSGMIGAFAAFNKDVDIALRQGVYLHGKAGDQSGDGISLTARGILASLPLVLNEV